MVLPVEEGTTYAGANYRGSTAIAYPWIHGYLWCNGCSMGPSRRRLVFQADTGFRSYGPVHGKDSTLVALFNDGVYFGYGCVHVSAVAEGTAIGHDRAANDKVHG